MKLLFDHNLSPRLVTRLADIFPDAKHVVTLGLDRASDIEVWQYARDNDFLIVTKDSDFNDLTALLGSPPKIIWLLIGNCTPRQVEDLLRRNEAAIIAFATDPANRILSLI
jgi:predicted nuclease of predicted toxin-antitoxin system